MAVIGGDSASYAVKIVADLSGVNSSFNEAGQVAAKFTAGVKAEVAQTTTLIERLGGTISTVLVGSSLVAGARSLATLADTSSSLRTQIELATGATNDAAQAQERLFSIASGARAPIESLADLYAKLARNATDSGRSQEQTLRLTETIAKSLTLGGGSKASNDAALTQLSQALGSGVLRGEELNSVLEQTPRLARAIADGLGVPQAKLRDLGQQGKLTADMVVQALSQSAEQIDAEFERMPTTIGSALTTMHNRVLQQIGVIDKFYGVTALAGGAIAMLSDHVGVLAAVIGGAAVAAFAAMARNLYLSVTASMQAAAAARAKAQADLTAAQAAYAEAAAENVLRQAQAARLVVAAELGGAQAIANSARTAAAASATALAAAEARLATAGAAAAGGATVLTRVLGLMGGPIGAVVTLIATLGIGMLSFGSDTAKGAEQAADAIEQSTERITASLNEQARVLEGRNKVAKFDVNTAQLSDGERRLMELSRGLAGVSRDDGGRYAQAGVRETKMAEYIAEIDQLSAALGRVSSAKLDQARITATSEWTKLRDAHLTGAEALKKALADYQKEYGSLNESGSTDAQRQQYADGEARIRRSFVDRIVADARKGQAQQISDLEAYQSQVKQSEETTQAALQAAHERGVLADVAYYDSKRDAALAYNAAQQRIVQQQINLALRAGDLAEVRKQTTELATLRTAQQRIEIDHTLAIDVELDKRLKASRQAAESSRDDVKTRVAAMNDEIAALQMSDREHITLAEAVERVALARREETLAAIEQLPGEEDRVKALREEIAARRDLAGLTTKRDDEKARQESAKKTVEDWKRQSKEIEQSITDALMRGFESGKDAGRNMIDTIKNMLLSRALKVLIEPVVSGSGDALNSLFAAVGNVVSGWLGGGSTNNSGGSGLGSFDTTPTQNIARAPGGGATATLAASSGGALASSKTAQTASSTTGALDVQINDYAGVGVDVKETRASDGRRQLKVFLRQVKQAVASDIATGGVTRRAITSSTTASARLRRRG